jgi:hypothetical protein
MSKFDTEQIVAEFVGDNPRAQEIAAMRKALAPRLAALKERRDSIVSSGVDSGDMATLHSQIAVMERQMEALTTELAVSRFIEDSIKAVVAKAEMEDEA